MAITLLDLYNAVATQEWSMYDNDAISESDFEDSLVLAINKAILEIYSSYNFSFRERTHLILTIPRVYEYDKPSGMIVKYKSGDYAIKYNSKKLKLLENLEEQDLKYGIPEYFYLKNDNILFSPVPIEKGFVTIDYYTLAIGENSNGDDIYTLSKKNDVLNVPIYLEALVKEAIITRTMLNTIASESDENYSAYKQQSDKALKLLIKYAKGLEKDKNIVI